MQLNSKQLVEKWKKVLEHQDLPKIADPYRRDVTAVLLENYSRESRNAAEALVETNLLTEADSTAVNASVSDGSSAGGLAGNVSRYDPILISLTRRSAPNNVAYDVCGVQPMTGPTGLIFAFRSKYVNGTDPNQTLGNEAFYNEAESGYSGTGSQAGSSPAILNDSPAGSYTYGTGMDTSDAERLGSTGGNPFNEMGFSIEKFMVEAKTRALKAQYTVELAQDLKQIHGLDAESELANILSTEILAEQNREVLRTIYTIAKPGAQNPDLTTPGVFDMQFDSNGRWAVEQFKGLLFQIERDANVIARETRRGKGNILICSSDVASALAMAGVLDYTPALSTNLQVDDTGNTFAGILNGKYKVYIDPYADPYAGSPAGENNFYVIGYRGASQFDAGLFYCPYVPLQMFKAIGPDNFQPRIGFKTRYGMVANPFAQGITPGLGVLAANSNVYYRRVKVKNLTSNASYTQPSV